MSDLIQEIKVRIVEEDMRRVFSNTQTILNKLYEPLREHFPDLDVRVYRALLGQCYPGTECLNILLRKQVDLINRLVSNDPDLNIFELGISKYFVADNILTMRAAHSISLAESQMTK